MHGSSGQCLTLGLPATTPTTPYITNNGTLQAKLWGGNGKVVAVLFNKVSGIETITAGWDALGLGLRAGFALPVRDVYARQDLGPATMLSAVVQPHGGRCLWWVKLLFYFFFLPYFCFFYAISPNPVITPN